MMKSLIIAPQWIGDAVMTEPLLRRLHAQDQCLSVAALPWVAPVYRVMPQVAEVIELPFRHGGLQWQARRAIAKQLRGQFDRAYVLPNSFKSALLPWLARIPKRVGYLGEQRYGLLTQHLPNPSPKSAMVAFYSTLSGDGDVANDRPQLHLSSVQIAHALQLVDLPTPSFYAAAPGAEFGSAKRWPAVHFAQLASKLDLPLVLLGGSKDQSICAAIAQAAPEHCINLAGKTTLSQVFGLLASAKAVVSNDSGLMHVAAALGVPQVAVFGSSSPLHTPPLNDRAAVLWLKNDLHYLPALDCAPCFQRDCPQGHTRCLNDIHPERVQQALLGVLG